MTGASAVSSTIATARFFTAFLTSSSMGDQSDRAMWETAEAWKCFFIEEFSCSSDARNCRIGSGTYRKNLEIDFKKDRISFLGGGSFTITGRRHRPENRQSSFSFLSITVDPGPKLRLVPDSTEFFYQGGILWRTYLGRFDGAVFTLQAYRCSPN